MSKWSGKSKGSVLGYRIFIFLIQKFPLQIAYSVLYFVALYYFFFSWKSSRASYQYFRKQLGKSTIVSMFSVYKHYYVFGQTLIDRFAISSGFRDKFTYEFDGIEKINEILAAGKGGILISAHVGNFEIAEYFFGELEHAAKINLVTTNLEHAAIQSYLSKFGSQSKIKFIIVDEDLSHIFQIHDALSKNEIICFTGDRYFPGTKTMEATLLNDKALFPAGTFQLAARLKVPVLFVYVMKEKKLHYHLYARKALFNARKGQELLNSYTENVSTILQKYPFQWFNFYDFWGK